MEISDLIFLLESMHLAASELTRHRFLRGIITDARLTACFTCFSSPIPDPVTGTPGAANILGIFLKGTTFSNSHTHRCLMSASRKSHFSEAVSCRNRPALPPLALTLQAFHIFKNGIMQIHYPYFFRSSDLNNPRAARNPQQAVEVDRFIFGHSLQVLRTVDLAT